MSNVIIQKARKNVNLVATVEKGFGRLDQFIGDGAVPYVCKECGGKMVMDLPPDTIIKDVDTLFKAMGRADVLSLRERALMEQDPSTRADLARMVLKQIRGEDATPEAVTIEASITPRPDSD